MLFLLLLDIILIMRYYLYATKVNNIDIKLEKIDFDKETKEELNRLIKTKKIQLPTISPYKTIFCIYSYELLALNYDENNNLNLIPTKKVLFFSTLNLIMN